MGDPPEWESLTTADATDGDKTLEITDDLTGKLIRGVVSYLDGQGTVENINTYHELVLSSDPNIPYIRLGNIDDPIAGEKYTIPVYFSNPSGQISEELWDGENRIFAMDLSISDASLDIVKLVGARFGPDWHPYTPEINLNSQYNPINGSLGFWDDNYGFPAYQSDETHILDFVVQLKDNFIAGESNT